MLPVFLAFPDQSDDDADTSAFGSLIVSAQSGDSVILAIRHRDRPLVDLVFDAAEARTVIAALTAAAALVESGAEAGA